MQLLIVFIPYLIIYSTCFERHPLIIRSFSSSYVLLPVRGTVLSQFTTRQCHGRAATQVTGGCTYSKEKLLMMSRCRSKHVE
jgi:hypothetical protein